METEASLRTILNVGGNNRDIRLPRAYDGWKQVLLDIDPAGKPDLCMDAREMLTLPAGTYDVVYCSHNLEHFYRFDADKVVQGMCHVVKPEGAVHIRVPDLGTIFQEMASRHLDLDDVLYHAAETPILVRHAIWGYEPNIQSSGQDYFAHKTGFTTPSLRALFQKYGRGASLFRQLPKYQLEAYFFRDGPKEEALQMLDLRPRTGQVRGPTPFAG